MSIPYIYDKIARKFEDRLAITVKEFKEGLINLRISEKEWIRIAKELEIYKLLDLKEVKAGNGRIKVRRKGLADFKIYILVFFMVFAILLFCIAYLYGFSIINFLS